MKKGQLLKLSLVASTLMIGLVGCGGGDSGSLPAQEAVSLSFPSNAAVAQPTIENAKRVKEVVAQDQQKTYSINAVTTSGSQNIAVTMEKVALATSNIDLPAYALNETLNQTLECSNSGTMNLNGSGSEKGGASFTVIFNSCDNDGVVLNGRVLTTMSNYNQTFGDYTTITTEYLSDVTASSSEFTAKIYKGTTEIVQISNINGYDSANTLKMELSAISEVNAKKSGQEGAIYYFDFSSSQPKMYQTAGKIYINNLEAYVDYDTSYDMSKTPFVFGNYGLESGEARYIMADGAKVKIVAESGVAKTYVDADGDGTYEKSE